MRMTNNMCYDNFTKASCRLVFVADLESSPEVEEAIERYDSLLRHIFQQAVPIIQSLLQEYPSNLDVTTEGRRFLYNYSKMTQFS